MARSTAIFEFSTMNQEFSFQVYYECRQIYLTSHSFSDFCDKIYFTYRYRHSHQLEFWIVSSKFIFDIKIPIAPIAYGDRDYDENEASQICEQRDLNFYRLSPGNYISSRKPAPFYIFCIVEIQGSSVLTQYNKLCFYGVMVVFSPMVNYEIIMHS